MTIVLGLLRARGFELPIAAICISLAPMRVSLYFGLYVLRTDPMILRGALAGQQASTPAINATKTLASNSVPVTGYIVTYSLANIFLPLLGPVFVTAFTAINGHPGAP